MSGTIYASALPESIEFSELEAKNLVSKVQKEIDRLSKDPEKARLKYLNFQKKIEKKLNGDEKRKIREIAERPEARLLLRECLEAENLDESWGATEKVKNYLSDLKNTFMSLNTEEIIIFFVMSMVIGYINKIALASLVPFFGSHVGLLILTCVIGPIVEESFKVLASKIKTNGGAKFGMVFGLIEASYYIRYLFSLFGAVIILVRIPILLGHYNSGKFYDDNTNKDGTLDFKYFFAGVFSHGLGNYLSTIGPAIGRKGIISIASRIQTILRAIGSSFTLSSPSILFNKKQRLEEEMSFKPLIKSIFDTENLNESEISQVSLVEDHIVGGGVITLTEEEIQDYVSIKEKMDIFESNLSEETKELLDEGIGSWFGYFFKGFSQTEITEFEVEINKIENASEAKEVVDDIESVIDKIKGGGSGSHSLANVFGVGAIAKTSLGVSTALPVLLVKHLVKSIYFKDDRKKAITKLNSLRNALVKKFNL